MEFQIIEVTSLADLRKFIQFPFSLYRNNPNWVPPLFFDEYNTLRRDKNPALEHGEIKYWLAVEHGKVIGRIAAIINYHHIEKWKQKYMRFGWFDFVDDPRVSQALLQKVEEWALETGMTAVHGPLGFTDMDREGMLVDGFDEPATLNTLYNYPYYPEHMERNGYKKDTDWVEYELTMPEKPVETITRAADIVLKRNHLKLLKPKNKKELIRYAKQIFQVLEEGYKHLYGAVPMSEKQVDCYIEQYLGFISPEFVPVILDENDHVVAFGIAIPSMTRAMQKANGKLFPFGFLHVLKALKENDRGDLYLVAVLPEYQGRGLNSVLMKQIDSAFRKVGIKKVESNPELETNQQVQAQWKHFESRQHKRRRCYIRHLEPGNGETNTIS